MKVRCIHKILDGKNVYEPGATAEFADDQAKRLIDAGAVEKVAVADEPAKKPGRPKSKGADLSDFVADE